MRATVAYHEDSEAHLIGRASDFALRITVTYATDPARTVPRYGTSASAAASSRSSAAR
jgi:hypothetical protein